MPEGKVFRSIINNITNKDAADEMEDILNEKKAFSNPKPSKLIEQILQLAADKDSLILDSFAGPPTPYSNKMPKTVATVVLSWSRWMKILRKM